MIREDGSCLVKSSDKTDGVNAGMSQVSTKKEVFLKIVIAV